MLNLVKVQEELKGMPLNVVMQYANGSNPQVPPYVALGELSRRKQMQESAVAAAPQEEAPTVKQSLEQQLGIMSLQNQRAQQAMQNVASAAARQPTIPPQQMAAGGITALPMRRDMFRRSDYAGGGIVAFQNNEDQPVSTDMPGVSEEDLRNQDQAEALFDAERRAGSAEKAAQILASAPPAPSGNPTRDLITKLVTNAGKAQTIEEIADEMKRAKEVAGVKEKPYEESSKRRAAIEEMYNKANQRQGMDELMGFLRGIRQTKPGQGVGVTLGGGAEEYQKEAQKGEAIRQKQQEQLFQWERADEKERDAIARGDAKALLEAKAEKDKLSYNIAKLSADKESLAYQKFMMAVNGDPYLKRLEEERKKKYITPGSAEDLKYDQMMNARKEQLAKEAGYDYRTVPYVNPVVAEPKPKKKSWWQSEDKKEEPKQEKKTEKKSVDSSLPPGLPAGTKAIGRTPSGEVIYRTPDGKQLIAQ